MTTIADIIAVAQQPSSLRDFRRALRAAVGQPLAYSLRDGFGSIAAGMLEQVVRGERVTDAQIGDLFARGPGIAAAGPAKSVGIVSMRGIALYGTDLPPICYSTLNTARRVKQLADDPAVSTIVLDVDSPGGSVQGVSELADAVWETRRKKTVVAIVAPLCASAAYWVASQSSLIIATESGDVGAVGVFMAHTDCSKFNEMQGMKITYIFAGEHKVEGNSDEPLSDEAKKHFQSEVDELCRSFHRDIARGRNTSVPDVASNFGRGRCLTASDALKVGMIDRIATPDEAFRLANSASAMRAARLASLQREPFAAAPKSEVQQVIPSADAERRRCRLALLAAEI
jgi:signal peptide peptidase SppA